MQEENGNILYAYSQAGNRLVLATFAWSSSPIGANLTGDMAAFNANPFVLGEGSDHVTSEFMGWNDGSALFDGVNTFGGGYRNSVELAEGAVLHATWSDGEAFVASKGNIIAINAFPEPGFGISGDYAQLFANALAMPVPAPGMLAMLGIGTLMTSRRRR